MADKTLASTAAQIDDAVAKRHPSDPVAIATYTHSTNKSAAASAVDINTDTITANGHPFVDTDKIYIVPNADTNKLYVPNLIIGGLAVGTGYFVVGKTANTFQVALTSGGAAINLTVNASIDFTKWHFENVASSAYALTGLTAAKKYRVRIKGRSVSLTSSHYVHINNVVPDDGWMVNTTFTYPSIVIGNLYADIDVLFDNTTYQTFDVHSTSWKTNTTSAIVMTRTDAKYYKNVAAAADITEIDLTINGAGLANGSTIEVFPV